MTEKNAYEEMHELWYHKELGKLAEWIHWCDAYESGICDNGGNDKLQILKQDAWDETTFEEWQNKYLINTQIDQAINETYADVVTDIIMGRTGEILTCVQCGKPIPSGEIYHNTGLTLKDDLDGGMIIFCDPRHIECESKYNISNLK